MFSDQKFILSENSALKDLLSKNGAKVIFENSIDDLTFESNDQNDAFFVIEDEQNFLRSDELLKKGVRVISSDFLYESIEQQKPLPLKDHPLYSSCFEGVTIAVDSNLVVKPRIFKLVKYMSGIYSETVTADTTALIATSVSSLDYKVAVENKIDVVQPQWIEDCWTEKKLLDKTPYKLYPFAGCVIAVTGLASPTRSEIKRLVEAYGGKYTPDLTRSCTHLLSKAPEGLKYHYAIQWGIHCVTPSWFFDSINDQCCKDERSYLLPIVSRRSIFSPRSRGDLGRMSPKLRSNHVSQIKRKNTLTPFPRSRRAPSMNIVFMDKKALPPSPASILKSQQHIPFGANKMALDRIEKKIQNNSISKEEVDQIISLCDETIKYYSDLAKEKDITELMNDLQKGTEKSD